MLSFSKTFAVQRNDCVTNSEWQSDLDSKLQRRCGVTLNTSRRPRAACGVVSLAIAPQSVNSRAGDLLFCPLNCGSIPGTAQKLGLHVLGRLMPEADRGEKGTLNKTARVSLPFNSFRGFGGKGVGGLRWKGCLGGRTSPVHSAPLPYSGKRSAVHHRRLRNAVQASTGAPVL